MTGTVQQAPARGRSGTLPFGQKLVLYRYLLGLFGVSTLEALIGKCGEDLRDPRNEEWDEENVSRFHHLLATHFPRLGELEPAGPSIDDLLRYDSNILRHTLHISRGRPARVRWKYFQYLSLLFTEIYLELYFDNHARLLTELNTQVAKINIELPSREHILDYQPDDLHKLAFWMATGSGKTLLMHVNVLQYQHYLEKAGKAGTVDNIILLTPNPGLSAQHLAEFELSGIEAERFEKTKGLFSRGAIQVLEITKLAEEMGKTEIAVDAFEGNNLVLVDEGHRGVAGEEWKDMRDRLAAQGFSFEYSATFSQAINAANALKKKQLTQEYARCILFDYSYRYFYSDGYGKDYQILNLQDGATEEMEHLYHVADLLTFYQQQLLYSDRSDELKPYNLDRPLWVFVGNSVTAEGSDVVSILKFLARFIERRDESIDLLGRLVAGKAGLIVNGRDVFANKFPYLAKRRLSGIELYEGILKLFFNAPNPGRMLVEELKGAEGELALRVGMSEAFGVINVGNAPELAKLAASEDSFDVRDRAVSGSVFASLNRPDSRVNLLIGSRKFTEGWNSYRVSSLGLLNLGKGEGSQIIQLFGRGVRLRGYGGNLQRSAVLRQQHPENIRLLETLNVFGLHADYMQQFKKYLEAEGVPVNEGMEEIVLPVRRWLPNHQLKTIGLKGGMDFKRDAQRVTLGQPPDDFVDRTIPLDFYPKLQAMQSEELRDLGLGASPYEDCLRPEHLAFMDLDRIYFELVRHKNERGWHNLIIQRNDVRELLADPRWYTLKIPETALGFGGSEPLQRVRMWEEIATALLKKYVERYYKMCREAFEAPLREYHELEECDANFIDEYQVLVPQEIETLLVRLRQVKDEIEAGNFSDFEYQPLKILSFDQHLYQPLLHLTDDKNKDFKITPVPLNEGEGTFVIDLRKFYEENQTYFEDKHLYLLRNLSRKGIGFFEANNFYPDFILWLLVGERQYMTFVDPKGIVRLNRVEDPKIKFHRKIKDIEQQLGCPNVILNSFIVPNTRYSDVASWGYSKEELRAHHVLFQKDDKATYIKTLLEMVVRSPEAG